MSDASLALLSNHLVNSSIAVYAVAMVGYATELALSDRVGRRARSRAESARKGVESSETPSESAMLVGARAGGAPAAGASPAGGGPRAGGGVSGAGTGSAVSSTVSRRARFAAQAGGAAIALTVVGAVVQAGGIATRGLSAHRLPWGNMYEFTLGLTFAAVVAFLLVNLRQRIAHFGLFIMTPVVLGLGIAVTVLYVPSAPLVPALHSYWLAIHVTAGMIAFGVFTVATVAAALQLLEARNTRLVAAGRPARLSDFVRRLPDVDRLDKVVYRAVAFAFPMWTFAVIAGAIWAEAAWGHYWQWDPKETWALITWIVYAAYLHARATAGWRGSKAAWVALAGYSTILFSYFVVNIFVDGMHSYAGV